MKIGIITPTYNRIFLLERLYKSLLKQNSLFYIWIIIDDGSTDSTESIIQEWINSDNSIQIRYYKKNNSGKSSALNYGFKSNPDIDFFAIVDSDDYLLDNAIQIITQKVNKYYSNSTVGAISFHYYDTNGKIIGKDNKRFNVEEKIMNIYQYSAQNINPDGCIGYYKRVVNEFSFPEYKNEIYVGPSVLPMLMASKYNIVFTNNVIGVAEYQPEGLSKMGRKLRVRNPLGMLKYCELWQSPLNPSKYIRMKYAIAAQAYVRLSKLSKSSILKAGIAKNCFKWWAYPFGWLLSIFWKICD